MRAPPICDHLKTAAQRSDGVTPSGHGCKECLESGGTWVHLRLCLGCGHVGCCDSSPGRHATKHFHATQHPVIRSYEPGESWVYCYAHDSFVDGVRPIGEEGAARHYSP